LGQEIQMRVVVAGDRDEEMGRQAVKELFEGSFRPDCIYCAGDGLAMGALMAAQEAGISVPDDLSVIGGNGLGSNLSTDRELTSMCHPIDMLGNRLVSMLLSRVELNGGDVPGVYLPPIFNLGESTSADENAILEELREEEG
ncbi:MAG TPA: substrate-binding domain-containing protein, partial [Opitutales bacterium]|nr:substrate-binding domain-containing protein [Opitutales bacterium]